MSMVGRRDARRKEAARSPSSGGVKSYVVDIQLAASTAPLYNPPQIDQASGGGFFYSSMDDSSRSSDVRKVQAACSDIKQYVQTLLYSPVGLEQEDQREGRSRPNNYGMRDPPYGMRDPPYGMRDPSYGMGTPAHSFTAYEREDLHQETRQIDLLRHKIATMQAKNEILQEETDELEASTKMLQEDCNRINEQLSDKTPTVSDNQKVIGELEKWLVTAKIDKKVARKYAEKLVLAVGMDTLADKDMLEERDLDMCQIKPIHKRKLMKDLGLSSKKQEESPRRASLRQGSPSPTRMQKVRKGLLVCSGPKDCKAMVSFNAATALDDATSLTTMFEKHGIPTFCSALWCPHHGGLWVEDVARGAMHCKYLVALVTDGWCKSTEVKAVMRMIVNRWKKDNADPKVILVRYDSELPGCAEENVLSTILPYFDGNQDVFYHQYGKKGIMNESWMSEVLTLVDVEADPEKLGAASVAADETQQDAKQANMTRKTKTTKMNADAKQLMFQARNDDDYEKLMQVLRLCDTTLEILEQKQERVKVNDVVKIKAQNSFSKRDGVNFKAIITKIDAINELITVKYEKEKGAVTTNAVTAGRRSGDTKADGTKTFRLDEFQKSLSSKSLLKTEQIKRNLTVLLKPTSAWAGVYKVTVVALQPGKVKVQYEERDRMVSSDGKIDDGLKEFTEDKFYDLLIDEVPLLADCLVTAAYAGGTASYKGLEELHWQTKEVIKEAQHDEEMAKKLMAQAQKRLDKAVEIYTSLNHLRLPNVRKQSAASFMNQYRNAGADNFIFGDVNASSDAVRHLGDQAIKTFAIAIEEFEDAGEDAMTDDDYVACFTLTGVVYKHRGELEKAEEWFQKAIQKQADVLAMHDPENKIEGRLKDLENCRAKLRIQRKKKERTPLTLTRNIRERDKK